MDIYDAMRYINGFPKLSAPVKDLIRYSRIMDALGRPYEHLKFVHVAGTNGKGSTVRMVANSLSLAGYTTGEFTSPFIKVYNDRIRINGKNISDTEICSIVENIKPIFDELDEECSQFELSTAIAFVYFAAKKCDVVVLEAGIGGLLDCTNIIENPLVSVITSISLDHTHILGDSIDKITRQKAGIIKQSCPVVLACNQKKEVHSAIYVTAISRECKFVTPNIEKLKIISSDYIGNKFTYRGMSYITAMLGKHQIDNALTAIEVCRVLRKNGFTKLTYVYVYEGVKTALVPSRCQVLRSDKPFIMIDGAHNPDGMRSLADFIREIPKEPKIMICGMMEDKDWQTAIGYISRYIDAAICVDGFTHHTVFAPKIMELFRRAETSSLRDAVSRAMGLAGEHGMVVIAGSLYLASCIDVRCMGKAPKAFLLTFIFVLPKTIVFISND